MTTDDELYHSGSHCRYLTRYHVIWCPKFRFGELGKDGRDEALKGILTDICGEYGYQIKAMEVMPDHIHMFVDAPQTVAPCDIARTLKSISAIRMMERFPDLKEFYKRCGVLWSRGYFISTIGHISGDTVQHYIEEQKHAPQTKEERPKRRRKKV